MKPEDTDDETDASVPRGILEGITDVAEGRTAPLQAFLDAKKF